MTKDLECCYKCGKWNWAGDACEHCGTESAPRSLREAKKAIERFEACFVRIAEAMGVSTPLILIANAKDNDENYAEILTRMIEDKNIKHIRTLI